MKKENSLTVFYFAKKYLLRPFQNIFSLDIRSLALFRIGLGIILFADVIMQAEDLTAFYTDKGVLPRVALGINQGIIALHALGGNLFYQEILLLIEIIAVVFFFVGYRTRIATIVLWIFTVSLQNRNPFIFSAGDGLLRMLLFWSMFLPLGAYYSIDSLRNKEKHDSTQVFSGGSIGFIIQQICLYVFASTLKTGIQWHHEASAIYYTLRIDQLITPLADVFIKAPPIVLMTLTHIVVYLERLGPLLFVIPFWTGILRTVGIFLFIGFHLNLGLFLRLGTFIWIPIVALLGMLPSWFWNTISALLQKYRPTKTTIYFDNDCGFCKNSVQIIKMFFFLSTVNILPAQQYPTIYKKMLRHNSWIVTDKRQKIHFKFDAFTTLLSISPVFWFLVPMFRWQPIDHIGNIIYRYIASKRNIFCMLPVYPKKNYFYVTADNILPLFFTIYIILWNITTVPHVKFSLLPPLRQLGVALKLDQRWDMFAPSPATVVGWFVIPGKLRDKTAIDLFRPDKPLSWKRPNDPGAEYKNERWEKYLEHVWVIETARLRPYYAKYLCETWNKNHPVNKQLTELDMYFMLEKIPKPFTPPHTTAKPIFLLHFACKNS